MRAVAAAALLALAWPAAARAADLGGGTAPTSVGGYRGQLTIVSVRTAPDGRAVVRAAVAARCGVGVIKATAPVAVDGFFSLTATKRDRAPEEPGIRRVAVVKVSGRIDGAAAIGTASTRIKLRRGGRTVDRCHTSARTWQARTPVPEAVAGPPRASRGYFGLTGQSERPHAFVLHVDARARRIQAAAFEYRRQCDGPAIESNDITPGGPIAADGTFSLRERFAIRYSNATERFRVSVDGRFTPNGVNGTLSVRSATHYRDGVTIPCRTGSVTFVGAL
jgi:hypothetical protein